MTSPNSSNSAAGADAGKAPTGIYAALLPTRLEVWSVVRERVANSRVRMDELAGLACQDPVIVIELLKTANSMFFSSGRPPVSTLKGTIERLGVDAALDTLDKMKEIPQITDPGLSKWFEISRARCTRVGKVARIFSDVLIRTLSEDCEAAGALVHVGELLAVAHFKEQYVKIAEEQQQRAKILYRLEKDLKFEAEAMGVNYMRRIGIPELVLFAIDQKAQSKLPARAPMRPICTAGSELVLAFETGKLDKYAPGSTSIPPKSGIRLLKMTDNQYASIFEQAKAYLLSTQPENSTSAQPAA